jgi:hypothetical protein
MVYADGKLSHINNKFQLSFSLPDIIHSANIRASTRSGGFAVHCDRSPALATIQGILGRSSNPMGGPKVPAAFCQNGITDCVLHPMEPLASAHARWTDRYDQRAGNGGRTQARYCAVPTADGELRLEPGSMLARM